MATAAALFQALDLDYYTPHLIGYIDDDHFAGLSGNHHAGQEFHDPNLIAKGEGILDFAVYQFLEFKQLQSLGGHLDDARDSETYKKALDSLWQAVDACIGTKIDRGIQT